MAIAGNALFPAVMAALEPLLSTSAHDALSARDFKTFFTSPGEPASACLVAWLGLAWLVLFVRLGFEGQLCLAACAACCLLPCRRCACIVLHTHGTHSANPFISSSDVCISADKLSFESEDGTIMAEEIFQRQLLSYRPIPPPTQLPDCPEEQQPGHQHAAASPSAAAASPAAAAAAAASRPNGAAKPAPLSRGAGGRPAGGRGGGAGKNNAAAEARVKQLAAEAEVRSKVAAVGAELARALAALAAAASGDRAFTSTKLDVLRPLVLPLLTSPLVGATAAFDCCRQLAACLPGQLAAAALPVTCSLRLIELTEQVCEWAPAAATMGSL
jgi:hypothetical protein